MDGNDSGGDSDDDAVRSRMDEKEGADLEGDWGVTGVSGEK